MLAISRRFKTVFGSMTLFFCWLCIHHQFIPAQLYHEQELFQLPPTNYEYDENLVDELAQRQQAHSRDQTCKFPILDPFDPSIMEYVKHPAPHQCAFIQPSLTYVIGNTAYKNHTMAQLWKAWQFEARTYYRPSGSDAAVVFGDWSKWETDTVKIRRHGIEVQALYMADGSQYAKNEASDNSRKRVKRRYMNIYPSVLPAREDDPKITKKWSTDPTERPPNVIVFGVDSVSKSNVIRNMPLTYKVLTERIGGYVMNGYSKIDDNTFPNMMAVLSGHRVTIHNKDEELSGGGQRSFVDDWPLIWKNFSSQGYVTLLSEEQPGIFSYKAKGFKEAPTDVYLRPYGAIMAGLNLYTRHLCFGNTPEAQLFLDAIKRFVEQHRDRPHFVFSFLWKWSHDHANSIQRIDHLMANMFTILLELGLFENTILMVMGDHGNRFDEIRRTLVGRYEERMPFLFVHTPRHLRERFAHLHTAMADNTWRLTCQYDVYETLVDVLNQDYGRERETLNDRGVSLFTPISKNRTCADVEIPEHFCVCQVEQPLYVKADVVKRSAKVLIDVMNDLISNYTNICSPIELYKIMGATHFEPTKQVLMNNRYIWDDFVSDDNVTGIVSHIRITVMTQPNSAVYESLIRCERADIINHGEETSTQSDKITELSDCVLSTTQGDISRINAYGRTADCISYKQRSLEPFCTCK